MTVIDHMLFQQVCGVSEKCEPMEPINSQGSVCVKDFELLDDVVFDFGCWLNGLSQMLIAGLDEKCVAAIDCLAMFYFSDKDCQYIKKAIADVDSSPYSLADCIFQAAIDIGHSVFAAGCITVDILDEAMNKS